MIPNVSNVVCYIDESMKTSSNGCLSKNSDGSFNLHVENFDEKILNKYFGKTINGVIGLEKFFVIESIFMGYGYCEDKGVKLFYLNFKITMLAIGENCFNIKKLRYNEAVCKFTNIDKWINLNNDLNIGNNIIDTFNIGNNITMSIKRYEEKNYKFVFSKENTSYEKFYNKICELKQLLTLLMFTNIDLTELCFSNKKNTTTIYFRKLDIIKDIDSSEIINYKNIGLYLKNIFEKYYSVEKKFRLFVSFICSSINEINNNFYVTAFLNIIKSIECMYSLDEFYPNFTKCENNNKKHINDIVNTINDEEIKNELNKLLKYSHKISLSEKLKQFFINLKEYLPQDYYIKKDNLIKKICDTRNYYTHLNMDNKNIVSDPIYLKELTYSLMIFSIYIFLLFLNDNKAMIIDCRSIERAKVFLLFLINELT